MFGTYSTVTKRNRIWFRPMILDWLGRNVWAGQVLVETSLEALEVAGLVLESGLVQVKVAA